MNKIVKRILIALGAFLGIIVLVVGGYVIYVVASYSRIEDNLALTPENASGGAVKTGEEYTVVTQTSVSELIPPISRSLWTAARSRERGARTA